MTLEDDLFRGMTDNQIRLTTEINQRLKLRRSSMDVAQHPEGLPFPPVGMGWTIGDQVEDSRVKPSSLLTAHNIESVKRNHPDDWMSAFEAIPTEKSARDPRSGRMVNNISDDERRRLATLAILVHLGVVNEPVVHPPEAKES